MYFPLPYRLPLLFQEGFRSLHYLGRCHLEHSGQLEQSPYRWATDSSFHEADIRSIETTVKSKLLLRYPFSCAKPPQRLTECPFRASYWLDLPPGCGFLLRFGPLRQQSNGDILRTIFPRSMFRICKGDLLSEVFGFVPANIEVAAVIGQLEELSAPLVPPKA